MVSRCRSMFSSARQQVERSFGRLVGSGQKVSVGQLTGLLVGLVWLVWDGRWTVCLIPLVVSLVWFAGERDSQKVVGLVKQIGSDWLPGWLVKGLTDLFKRWFGQLVVRAVNRLASQVSVWVGRLSPWVKRSGGWWVGGSVGLLVGLLGWLGWAGWLVSPDSWVSKCLGSPVDCCIGSLGSLDGWLSELTGYSLVDCCSWLLELLASSVGELVGSLVSCVSGLLGSLGSWVSGWIGWLVGCICRVIGWVAAWVSGWVGWLVGGLFGWSMGWSFGWSGWLFGRVSWWFGWWMGWFIAWLAFVALFLGLLVYCLLHYCRKLYKDKRSHADGKDREKHK